MTAKPKRDPVPLSAAELGILTVALWHWEDCLRSGRGSVARDDAAERAEYDRKIAATRNLKMRMFRAKPSQSSAQAMEETGMKPQKQLNRHDPKNGIYDDCHRTAIACVLDMDANDVPHFMDGRDAGASHEAAEAWLNERGITQINVLFGDTSSLEDVLTSIKNYNATSGPHVFILGGRSRNDVNHSVVCCDGEIVCDPSIDNSGIVGPCDDGYWWVTFFGSLRAVHRGGDASVKAEKAA